MSPWKCTYYSKNEKKSFLNQKVNVWILTNLPSVSFCLSSDCLSDYWWSWKTMKCECSSCFWDGSVRLPGKESQVSIMIQKSTNGNHYLPARHQLLHRRHRRPCDVTHAEVRHVNKNNHASNKHLFVFISQYFRHHKTNTLNVLKLSVITKISH